MTKDFGYNPHLRRNVELNEKEDSILAAFWSGDQAAKEKAALDLLHDVESRVSDYEAHFPSERLDELYLDNAEEAKRYFRAKIATVKRYANSLHNAPPEMLRELLKAFFAGRDCGLLDTGMLADTFETGTAVYENQFKAARERKRRGKYRKERTKADGITVKATPANTMLFYRTCLERGDTIKSAMFKTCREFGISTRTIDNHRAEIKETDPALADAVEKAKAALK